MGPRPSGVAARTLCSRRAVRQALPQSIRARRNTNTYLVTSVQNDIGEEEATLVLRHEIGGTSARLCIIYKQSTFTHLFLPIKNPLPDSPAQAARRNSRCGHASVTKRTRGRHFCLFYRVRRSGSETGFGPVGDVPSVHRRPIRASTSTVS